MRYNIARGFATGLKDVDGALDLLGPAFEKLHPGGIAWVGIEADFGGRLTIKRPSNCAMLRP